MVPPTPFPAAGRQVASGLWQAPVSSSKVTGRELGLARDEQADNAYLAAAAKARVEIDGQLAIDLSFVPAIACGEVPRGLRREAIELRIPLLDEGRACGALSEAAGGRSVRFRVGVSGGL